MFSISYIPSSGQRALACVLSHFLYPVCTPFRRMCIIIYVLHLWLLCRYWRLFSMKWNLHKLHITTWCCNIFRQYYVPRRYSTVLGVLKTECTTGLRCGRMIMKYMDDEKWVTPFTLIARDSRSGTAARKHALCNSDQRLSDANTVGRLQQLPLEMLLVNAGRPRPVRMPQLQLWNKNLREAYEI
jgi:hypothetical protein